MTTLKPTTALGTAEWIRDGLRVQAPLSPRLLSEELYFADEIRKGNHYPGQRNYHGWYWLSATRAHVWHESLLERSALMRLDFVGGLVAAAAQPMKLQLGDWTHVPDLLVLHGDGTQTLIDVKPRSRVERHREQFETTARVCEAVGWGYRVLSELEPQKEANLHFLAAYRLEQDGPSLRVRETVTTAYAPGWTFLDLALEVCRQGARSADAQRMALAMLWSRDFTFDLSERLTHSTRLYRPCAPGMEAVDAL